jgi:outer membrane cobalamin receptor
LHFLRALRLKWKKKTDAAGIARTARIQRDSVLVRPATHYEAAFHQHYERPAVTEVFSKYLLHPKKCRCLFGGVPQFKLLGSFILLSLFPANNNNIIDYSSDSEEAEYFVDDYKVR